MGNRLLEVYPEIVEDFWEYDQAIMGLFCGIPKVFIPKKHAARARMISGFSKYHKQVWEECKGKIPDPDSIPWEPLYGSRYNRARQLYYEEQGIACMAKTLWMEEPYLGLEATKIPRLHGC